MSPQHETRRCLQTDRWATGCWHVSIVIFSSQTRLESQANPIKRRSRSDTTSRALGAVGSGSGAGQLKGPNSAASQTTCSTLPPPTDKTHRPPTPPISLLLLSHMPKLVRSLSTHLLAGHPLSGSLKHSLPDQYCVPRTTEEFGQLCARRVLAACGRGPVLVLPANNQTCPPCSPAHVVTDIIIAVISMVAEHSAQIQRTICPLDLFQLSAIIPQALKPILHPEFISHMEQESPPEERTTITPSLKCHGWFVIYNCLSPRITFQYILSHSFGAQLKTPCILAFRNKLLSL